MEIEKLILLNESNLPLFSKWKNLPYIKRNTWGFSAEERREFEHENRIIWVKCISPLIDYLNKKPELIEEEALKKFPGDLTMQKYLYQLFEECKKSGLDTDGINKVIRDAHESKNKKR